MDLVSLTEFLVRNITKNPDSVTVKQISEEEDHILIQVLVSEEDMGVVIGKGGTMSKAIRTIVSSAALLHNLKKVKINIDSF